MRMQRTTSRFRRARALFWSRVPSSQHNRKCPTYLPGVGRCDLGMHAFTHSSTPYPRPISTDLFSTRSISYHGGRGLCVSAPHQRNPSPAASVSVPLISRPRWWLLGYSPLPSRTFLPLFVFTPAAFKSSGPWRLGACYTAEFCYCSRAT